jgi:glutamyl/glutaminyl-tRNA synthetase
MMLFKLAQSGRILEVQEHAARLAKSDEAYLPFCDQLQELARGFELDRIVAFVRQFVQEEQNGTHQ